MKPQDIADFVCGEEKYFYSEEREFLSKEDLVFYEIESNIHVYNNLDGKDRGKVFLGKKEIAVSFKDFIIKQDIVRLCRAMSCSQSVNHISAKLEGFNNDGY